MTTSRQPPRSSGRGGKPRGPRLRGLPGYRHRYQALRTALALEPVDKLMDLTDVLVEVRALAQLAETVPTKNAEELVEKRLALLDRIVALVTSIRGAQNKTEAMDLLVQARVQMLLGPCLLGMERMVQKYVPPAQWREALEDLRAIAKLPQAAIEAEAHRLTEGP